MKEYIQRIANLNKLEANLNKLEATDCLGVTGLIH